MLCDGCYLNILTPSVTGLSATVLHNSSQNSAKTFLEDESVWVAPPLLLLLKLHPSSPSSRWATADDQRGASGWGPEGGAQHRHPAGVRLGGTSRRAGLHADSPTASWPRPRRPASRRPTTHLHSAGRGRTASVLHSWQQPPSRERRLQVTAHTHTHASSLLHGTQFECVFFCLVVEYLILLTIY